METSSRSGSTKRSDGSRQTEAATHRLARATKLSKRFYAAINAELSSASFRLLGAARDELEGGVAFYDSKYPGLGADFALEVNRLCGQRCPESRYTIPPSFI